MTTHDQRLLRLAIHLAQENLTTGVGGPFGAVIARGTDILATASNEVTSTNDPTAHAEVVAIRQACLSIGHYSLAGCILYASCEPCPMCLAATYWARIDRLYYAASRHDAAEAGFDDEFLYRELVLPVNERIIPTHQQLASEGAAIFTAWSAKTDKVMY
ncbi:tRNA(Arg) A34 adenosine deaminase TadA [Prosthecobacter debontii]|uniref:tRNA(Arg) A34 adenosine deaminase TadA n=1 Tax=Prosthecobacter debontii TaxID=48467 RepID=A0A1T4Z3I6_9BACT|nr:nucleoside deaminase [Prosthecobacter debontii]SKB08408.1 tRNA(Arg) A34 adenosine deaminase TadA [Prosthecobacter debontii]